MKKDCEIGIECLNFNKTPECEQNLFTFPNNIISTSYNIILLNKQKQSYAS